MVYEIENTDGYRQQFEEIYNWMLSNKFDNKVINRFRQFFKNAEESNEKYIFTWWAKKDDLDNGIKPYQNLYIEVCFTTIKSPTYSYRLNTSAILCGGKQGSRSSSASINSVRYTLEDVLERVLRPQQHSVDGTEIRGTLRS